MITVEAMEPIVMDAETMDVGEWTKREMEPQAVMLIEHMAVASLVSALRQGYSIPSHAQSLAVTIFQVGYLMGKADDSGS